MNEESPAFMRGSVKLRVLVTGSRNLGEGHRQVVRDALLTALAHYASERTPVLVHGAARGADTIAEQEWLSIANQMGKALLVERHPADWDHHGKKAGMIRNQAMVDLGATVVIAFPLPGSIGTYGCMRAAKRAGIRVVDYGPVLATLNSREGSPT